MTFNSFLFFGVIFVVFLVIVALANRNWFTDSNKARWVYFSLLVAFGFSAILTVNAYLYPKNKTAYDSTDYHLLEHTGFRFDNQLNLASPNPPEGYPNSALWDSKAGRVDLTRDSNQFVVKTKGYYEPFFVSKKTDNENYFTVINNIIGADVSTGFELK